MIELRTLGSVDLYAPAQPTAAGVLRQPKRCAVLVYLAVAAPHGFVRRDTLLALFWPEADQARGRNALRQTIYQLRQFLGADVIRSRGDEEVGVDSGALSCDVSRFETLLAAGDPAAALEVYRGDFLTGFHVPDAALELEEWQQSRARQLRALATAAAWSLAQAEAQRGNAGGAGHWARRAFAFEPFAAQRVAEVMLLLARVGDRAGALDVYQEYARRTGREFGILPDDAVRAVAAALRAETDPPAAVRGADEATVRPDPDARQPTGFRAALTSDARPRTRLRARLLIAVAAGLAVLGLGSVLRDRLPASAADGPQVIAVGRIGDASEEAGPGATHAADLLSTSLARLQGVQVVPYLRVSDVQAQLRAAGRPATSVLAAARQLGAAYLLEGSTQPSGDGGLHLDLQLIDVRTGSIARAHRVTGRDLFNVVDAATGAVALVFDAPTPREPIAQVTTRSLVAYRLYDQGLHAYYVDNRTAAYRLFAAALAEDSGFAMAAYYAGLSSPHVREQIRLLHHAVRLAQRVTDRERLLILEGSALNGVSGSVLALADTLAVRYPLDPDAQFVYGHVLMHRAEFTAAARHYRRVIDMDSLSLHGTARCLACDAYGHLIWAYLHADSAAAAERVALAFAQARPSRSTYATLHMVRARQHEFAAARRALVLADSIGPGSNDLAFLAVTLALREGAFTTADTRLRQLMAEAGAPTRELATWYLILSLRMQGRLREALALARQHSSGIVLPLALLEIGRPAEAAIALEKLVPFMDTVPMPGTRARHRAFTLTHLATSLAAAGDTARLSAIADSVEAVGQLSVHGRDVRLHHFIRGLLWKARAQPDRAAAAFRSSIWSWSEGYTRANHELAGALMMLDRPAEAVYPLQAALRGDLESSNLYVSQTELHERLAQAFDRLEQRDSAAAHYRYVARAWSGSDAPLQPRFRHAQDRLRALTTTGIDPPR